MSRGAMKIAFAGLIALAAATVVVTVARQRAENRQALHAQIDKIDALRQRHDAKVAALKDRMAEVGLGNYLTAQQLASPEGARRGQEALARYRALLSEREHLLDDMSAQSLALLATLPRGRARDDALLGQAIVPSGSVEVRRRLSIAMAANADAVQAVFDWVGRNQRYLHAQGDKLLIEGQPRIARLDDLQYTVGDTAKAVQEAAVAAGKVESQSSQALESLRRDVDH